MTVSRAGSVASGLGRSLRPVLALALTVGLARTVEAQQNRRCLMELVNVDRQGVRVEPAPGTENFFAGGKVHLKCRGQKIDMYADSVASYQGRVIQFIGKVRYRDSTTAMDADFGTYFKDGEHFEAQGNVLHRDLKDGSTITGPRVDYFRQIQGQRKEVQVIADGRPTIRYAVKDSLGKPLEPYTIVGDRTKLVGSDVIFSGGTVTIDRSDLRGRSDSLWLDSGTRGAGQLLRNASLRSVSKDSFALVGNIIDLKLVQKELSYLQANTDASLTSQSISIKADSIGIKLTDRKVEQTIAWGKKQRPVALSGDYEVRGDSLAIDTPEQKLNQVRSFRKAWAGFHADTSGRYRDWISGEKVVAYFVERDSAGTKKSTVERLEAEHQARSYYQVDNEKSKEKDKEAKPTINYSRADHIVVTMRITADSTKVDKVEATGNVDGIHLEPAKARADTTKQDSTSTKRDSASTKRDTTPTRRRPDTTSARKRPSS